MELTRKRKRFNNIQSGSLVEFYPHDLQLYTLPPITTITLSEFEDFAVERIKVLRILELANFQVHNKYSEEWREAVITEMKKQGLKLFAKLVTGSGLGQTEADLQARRRDHISHFVLRLAYCRSEDLRRWFVMREIELFRMRFHYLSKEAVKQFLQRNNLEYAPISEEQKVRLKDHLVSSTAMLSPTMVESMDFFCVPFVEVLDLIKTRKVYLANGCAYIPSTDLISVVLSHFRINLQHSLSLTVRQLPNLEEDERLQQFLSKLHTSYTGEKYYVNKNKSDIQVEQLDSLSRSSFPLCMRQMHESIRSIHHARHTGRMQYGLFLKGIGLSLANALRFWKEEFTKNMDADRFEKQYAYNVRHNYGKEGKHTNYTPYSCLKIIRGDVGPGDNHGCPFKHSDIAILKQRLFSYNLPALAAQEVLDYVSRGHFQLACGKYFEITHGKALDAGVNHPNEYFEESQKLIAGKETSNTGNNKEFIKSKPVSKSPQEDSWGEDFDFGAIEAMTAEGI